MQKDISILFYISASNGIGLGHLVRCHAIALAHSAQIDADVELKPTFTFAADDRQLATEVTGGHYTVISPDEVLRHNYDIIITDYLELSLEKQHVLKKQCKLLVGINDSDPGPFAFDLLFRPNILNLEEPVFVDSDSKLYSGADYILLHPLYALTREMDDEFKTDFAERTDSITVCFGGSDPANLTMRTVEALAEVLPYHIIHLITGAGYAHLDELNKLLKNGKFSKFMHQHNVSTLGAILPMSKLAIISGGTLLYECCASGTPAITICQNQEQSDEADIFASKGTVLNLGQHDNVDERDITIEVGKLATNQQQLKKMNDSGEELISGNGAILTLKTILGQFSTEK